MTGQGFTSTYTVYKKEDSAEKEIGPYASQVEKGGNKLKDKGEILAHIKNKELKNTNIKIFDFQNRSQSQAARRNNEEDGIKNFK